MGAELGPLLAGGGVFATLAVVITYLLAALDKQGRRADERIDAANRRADEATVRGRELQLLLDEARKDRRAAEDRADRLERKMRDLDAEVKELRIEVAGLRAQHGYPGGPT